jgi:hypothetical protein
LTLRADLTGVSERNAFAYDERTLTYRGIGRVPQELEAKENDFVSAESALIMALWFADIG